MISEAAVWTIWALPVAAFIVIAAGVPAGIFRRTPRLAAWIAIAAIFVSFLLSIWALMDVWDHHGEVIGFPTHTWLEVGGLTIDMGIHLDGLADCLDGRVRVVPPADRVVSGRQVDGNRVVPALAQLGDDEVPVPRAAAAAVDQRERAHVSTHAKAPT